MPLIQLKDFAALPWTPHPKLDGIESKFIDHQAESFPPDDYLLARVAVGGMIPWHEHPHQSEFAYVLSGVGVLHSAASEAATTTDAAEAQSVRPGMAFVVPPRVWHALENTDDEPLIVLALHLAE